MRTGPSCCSGTKDVACAFLIGLDQVINCYFLKWNKQEYFLKCCSLLGYQCLVSITKCIANLPAGGHFRIFFYCPNVFGLVAHSVYRGNNYYVLLFVLSQLTFFYILLHRTGDWLYSPWMMPSFHVSLSFD